jgi:hypothetical protein
MSGVFAGEKNIMAAYPAILHHLFSAYIGYTIYDMATMVKLGSEAVMWVHHLVGLGGGFLIMVCAGVETIPS